MKEDNRIPIITLHQPWCKWIAMGWKTIETRLHSRFKNLKGKRIGIHVGQKWDKYAIETAKEYLSDDQIKKSGFLKDNGGYIICTAHVSDFRVLTKKDSDSALIDCDDIQRFGLFLTNIKRTLPALVKGHQGIWYLNKKYTKEVSK